MGESGGGRLIIEPSFLLVHEVVTAVDEKPGRLSLQIFELAG